MKRSTPLTRNIGAKVKYYRKLRGLSQKQLAAQLQEVLSALLPQRREAAADFARQLEEELRQLGFSEQVRVIPDFMPQEVWPGLMDEKVRILWARPHG